MQVLIVDADTRSMDRLRGMLKEITDTEILCFGRRAEALLDVEEGHLDPEVCFIDLASGESAKAGPSATESTDGISFAQKLKEMLPAVQIIFTSEHDTFYPQVYEAEHIWLLKKPVDSMLLRKAWSRAMQCIDRRESRYFTYCFAKHTYQIPLKEILYFEKDRRRIIIHTTESPGESEGTVYFYGTMDELMPRLDGHFLRCHNSYVVNLSYVNVWNKTVFNIGKHKIPISRKYAKVAKAAFFGV